MLPSSRNSEVVHAGPISSAIYRLRVVTHPVTRRIVLPPGITQNGLLCPWETTSLREMSIAQHPFQEGWETRGRPSTPTRLHRKSPRES